MFVSTLSYANPADLRAAGDRTRLHRPAPREALPRRVDDERPAANDSRGPRTPLVAAMLQAMQTLTGASTAAPVSDATTDTVAADATTGAAPTRTDAAGLKEAAMAFAHELFGALRSEGGGGGRQGHGHHHGHGTGQGYGQLAQRLEQLAQRLDAAPAPTPDTPTTPAPEPTPLPAPAPAPAPVDTLPPTTGPVPLPAPADEATPANGSVSITININLGSTTSAARPLDALKSAFEQLFKALQPAASAPAAGADLAGFLRSMAEALRGGGDAAAASTPAPGGLLNLVA